VGPDGGFAPTKDLSDAHPDNRRVFARVLEFAAAEPETKMASLRLGPVPGR
jgi:hypothetical protein